MGKSTLACDLAQALGAEIVGADAFQVYSGMATLTAQAKTDLTSRIPHHLVGCVSPQHPFDVAAYLQLAQAAIAGISARGRVPFVVGGTGLYLRALISGLSPTPPANPPLRDELASLDLPSLVERLRIVDPDAPAQVDLKNRRRVERAIEICETSGKPLTAFRNQPRPSARGILLIRDRDGLHARIASNIDEMFRDGVVEEVRALENIGPTAEKAIGFDEIRRHIAGEFDAAECRHRILIATRQYAKRQLTWFRNQFTFPTLELTASSSPGQVISSALRLLDAA